MRQGFGLEHVPKAGNVGIPSYRGIFRTLVVSQYVSFSPDIREKMSHGKKKPSSVPITSPPLESVYRWRSFGDTLAIN